MNRFLNSFIQLKKQDCLYLNIQFNPMIIKTKNDISMFDQLWWTFSFKMLISNSIIYIKINRVVMKVNGIRLTFLNRKKSALFKFRRLLEKHVIYYLFNLYQ